MAKKKNKKFDLSKINYKELGTRAAGLAVGGIASGLAGKTLMENVFQNQEDQETAKKYSNAIIAIGGLFLSEYSGDPFLKSVGDGMATMGATLLTEALLPDNVKESLGIDGVGMAYGHPTIPGQGQYLAGPNYYVPGNVAHHHQLAGAGVNGLEGENLHEPVLGGATIP